MARVSHWMGSHGRIGGHDRIGSPWIYHCVRVFSRKETSNDSGVANLRVMRMCCVRMLKFIGCVRNKLAVSTDVGFGGDSFRCRFLRG